MVAVVVIVTAVALVAARIGGKVHFNGVIVGHFDTLAAIIADLGRIEFAEHTFPAPVAFFVE